MPLPPPSDLLLWTAASLSSAFLLLLALRAALRSCFHAHIRASSRAALLKARRRATLLARALPVAPRGSWQPFSPRSWRKLDDEGVTETAGDEAREAARHRALLYGAGGEAVETSVQPQVEIVYGAGGAAVGARVQPQVEIAPGGEAGGGGTRAADELYIRYLEEQLAIARRAVRPAEGGGSEWRPEGEAFGAAYERPSGLPTDRELAV
ncbi:hypothetical protein AB1Y20_018472 [Prymnesium parvum]|uniref:Uncharacterized protein n=1 Tax=Prymnesium parvum TaxID=97485 RepID=A0AB34JQ21_PRYPA